MMAAGIVGERERADQDRADQADGVGLKNVRRHAGAIAHVVAHVVRDRGRIARIVFVEIALDFAHEIGAHVGRLGVNAAAESREDADQTRAQRQADQAFDREVVPEPLLGQRVEDADRKQRQTDDEKAGDGAAVEGDAHGRGAGLVAAWVVRILASTAMRIPM